MLVKRNNALAPSLFNDFFKPDWFGGIDTYNSRPAVNIRENDNDYLVELAIPGFKKDDFVIEVDNDVLTISSEVENNSEEKTENYSRREFSISSFKRAFVLPETVDDGAITANYEGGILKVTLPKREEALPKPKRLIEIG